MLIPTRDGSFLWVPDPPTVQTQGAGPAPTSTVAPASIAATPEQIEKQRQLILRMTPEQRSNYLAEQRGPGGLGADPFLESAVTYDEAKGRAASSRSSLEGLIQQFHDIAAGRTKTDAEKAFEEQYQGAQASAFSTMLGLEGVDPGEALRLRAQQAGAIQARREQDQRVLREQITDQAKQQVAGLTGVLNQGDQERANLDALYRQGMSAVDWEAKTGQAAQAWQEAGNAYGLATKGAQNALGDYGRDAAFWQGLAGNVAELGGTAAAYGKKSGWFSRPEMPTPTGSGPAGQTYSPLGSGRGRQGGNF